MNPLADIALIAIWSFACFIAGALLVVLLDLWHDRKRNKQLASMLPPPINTGPEDLFKTLEYEELERMWRVE